jgi:DNA-binding response OmpR family regulator
VSEARENLVYACDQWEIDLGRRELRAGGIPVPLGGRAFEVVTVLAQSASEFVTKDHLMERCGRAPSSAKARSTFTFPQSARRWARIVAC